MSRIGKQIIEIPQGVTVDVKDGIIKVKGPKGELERKLNSLVTINIADNKVIKIKPDHKLTLYKLGRIYYTLKNYNVAIDMLNNAIKIAKKESHIPSEKDKKSLQSSYQVLALANYELNHFEEAISYLKKSLKIKTNIDHGDYNVLTEKETLKLLKLLNEKKK